MQARGFSNKNLEVEYMANRLKALSKELNTCIVVLAQLSREVEKRADKRPILSDLRDSGGIEQASNMIMFLYRDDYYSKQKENDEKLSILEVIVRKNRDGDLGTAYLAYNRITQEITDIQIDDYLNKYERKEYKQQAVCNEEEKILKAIKNKIQFLKAEKWQRSSKKQMKIGDK